MHFALELVVRAPPFVAQSGVREACARGGAVVLSAQALSNKALVYHVEVPSQAVPPWLDQLRALGTLGQVGADTLHDHARVLRRSERDIAGSLHVTLVHDEPDEAIVPPSVPG